MAPTSKVDHYLEDNRRHGLVYSAETDPDILAEEEEEEVRLKDAGNASGGSSSGIRAALHEDGTDDSDSDVDEEDSSPILTVNLNAVEKVC